jgi:hypothetical protein
MPLHNMTHFLFMDHFNFILYLHPSLCNDRLSNFTPKIVCAFLFPYLSNHCVYLLLSVFGFLNSTCNIALNRSMDMNYEVGRI